MCRTYELTARRLHVYIPLPGATARGCAPSDLLCLGSKLVVGLCQGRELLNSAVLKKLAPVVAILALLVFAFVASSRGPFPFNGKLVACLGYGTGYGYTAGPPSVTAIGPNNGTDAGGTSVGISGQGFCNFTASVHFGATLATSFGVDSDTHITAVSPAHSPTIVHITVTNAAGTSAVN